MLESRKASVFLWFDSEAEDAARFYAETFPDSRIDNLVRPVNDVPGTKAGEIIQIAAEGFMLHDRLLRPAQVGVSSTPV